MEAFYIILTGSLVAVACALLGSLLVLRKMAMVGDAISHAVLPGIVIAYLATGSRDSWAMLLGAMVLGVVCTWMIELIHKRAGLQTDAAIGVSFTSLFAVGVILISLFASQVDLDQECVLYGEIAYTPLDLLYTDGGLILGPRQAYILAGVLALVAAFMGIFYKEIKLLCFDERFAIASGINVVLINQLLMGAVSLSTVAAFESVGAILVVAFLSIPPAAAFLITRQFKHMLGLACLFGVTSAVAGFYISWHLGGSIAAAMALCSTGILGACLLFSFLKKRVLAAEAVVS